MERIIRFLDGFIEKGKRYVTPGSSPPKGVTIHEGPNGGHFYYVEDKHIRHQGKEHELIRSRGVTKTDFDTLTEKYKAQGAESVHFVHKPGLERDGKGNFLYNIYVNWGDQTQKKIADKQAADKVRFGHPRIKDIENPEFTETDGVVSTPAYDRTDKGYVQNGRYEIHPSGAFGAKLYFIDKKGTRSKVHYSNNRVWGEKSETDVDIDRSRDSNVAAMKHLVRDLTQSGSKRRQYYISTMKQRDEERAANPPKEKPPMKNPNWENHRMMAALRMLDAPGTVPEIDAHEAALQHKRGDTPVREFFAGHLRKHFPGASAGQIDEAARSAHYHHTSNTGNKHRLSDAYQHGVNVLTRLMKQPAPETKPAPGPVKFPKVKITLPHDNTPGMKRWVRKITHYFPGDNKLGALNDGMFLSPDAEANGKQTFSLEDGLYETAQGPKSNLNSQHRRYVVMNGKIREVDVPEFNKHLKSLPFRSAEEITTKIKRESDAKRKEKEQSPGKVAVSVVKKSKGRSVRSWISYL